MKSGKGGLHFTENINFEQKSLVYYMVDDITWENLLHHVVGKSLAFLHYDHK